MLESKEGYTSKQPILQTNDAYYNNRGQYLKPPQTKSKKPIGKTIYIPTDSSGTHIESAIEQLSVVSITGLGHGVELFVRNNVGEGSQNQACPMLPRETRVEHHDPYH